MAVDVLETLLEEDDEVVQVSSEVMAQLFLSCKNCGGQLESYIIIIIWYNILLYKSFILYFSFPGITMQRPFVPLEMWQGKGIKNGEQQLPTKLAR